MEREGPSETKRSAPRCCGVKTDPAITTHVMRLGSEGRVKLTANLPLSLTVLTNSVRQNQGRERERLLLLADDEGKTRINNSNPVLRNPRIPWGFLVDVRFPVSC
jgi:hypothetical protein